MKTAFLILSLLVFKSSLLAQQDTMIVQPVIDTLTVKIDAPPEDTLPPPKALYNKYGDLLHDDTAYNKRSSWIIPTVRVLSANIFNYALARYVNKVDWVSSGPKDWKNNFKLGPEWDVDGFGTNFFAHPYAGSIYFNAARSNGYSYFGSLPFAIQGSLTWEWLAENTRPSWNDLINTPISGAFLGEVFYRLSSNILDDRATGANRF